MKINTLPYWLKGGLTALVVLLIPILCMFFISSQNGSFIDLIMILMLSPFAFGAFWFGGVLNLTIGISQQALMYFAIGSVIGFLYGKFKK